MYVVNFILNPHCNICLNLFRGFHAFLTFVCFWSISLVGFPKKSAVQFSLVPQSCPTLCDPMDCSMPGFPVYHQLLELAQTHVHQASDAFQLSHPLSSSSAPDFNLSQLRDLFTYQPEEFLFQCLISFSLFIQFMGFPRQEYWSSLPFPSPVDHVLSERFTMIRPSWVALHSMAHSLTELDKAVTHIISLVSFLWLWFSCYLHSDG